MEEKRRFGRISCFENVIVQCGKGNVEATILDISLKGALLEFTDDLIMREGDKCLISLNLKDSDVFLQFLAESIHNREHRAGVKFVRMDIDSFIHLRNLLETRAANPQQVRDEIAFLMEGIYS